MPTDPPTRPDPFAPVAPVDVVHVCFGGLGGHGAIVRLLATELAGDGLRSAAILHAPAGDIDADPAHWPGLDAVVAIPRRGKVDLAAMVAVARTVRRLRPRVALCHTHESIPAVFVGQLLARRRPRVVIVEHQSIGLRRRLEDVRSAIALPFCRAVVVLSDDYRRRYPFRRWPLPAVRRLTVIPNGIDTGRFAPAPDPAPDRAGDRPVTLGMGCRLVAIKDLDTLVDAVALLVGPPGPEGGDTGTATGTAGLRLRLAGEGPSRAPIEAQVRRLGLGDHVELTGSLDAEAMLAFYASLDIYVQATLGETASISLLEAYACGLAVIASDVEGVQGFVRDGDDGVLVPPRDATRLAAAIAALAADPAERARLGAAARHRIERDFSARAMADRYLELFATIGAG